MKLNFKTILIAAFLVTAPLFMLAQTPPLPDDPAPDTEVGAPAGAPVGNGTFILLTLAAAYALRKVYEVRMAKEEVTG